MPVQETTWLQLDDAFDGQMALRDRLIAEKADVVLGQLPSGLPAAEELFDVILSQLSSAAGYHVAADSVTRPDGMTVPLDRSRPLATLGRLVQEDLCLMEKQGDQHVLLAPVVVVEGIFVLYYPELTDLLDLKIFLDAKDHIKLKRRIIRDKVERGYDLDDVLYRYEMHVMPTYEKYIEPFKNEADLIIPNNHNFDRALDVIRTYLRSRSVK